METISHLTLPKSKGLEKITIDLASILYFKGDVNYTSIKYFNKKRELESRKIASTIKKYQTNLPSDRFIRIHRNTILNMEYIKEYKNDFFIMNDGSEHTISRRNMQIVKSTRMEYLNKSSSKTT